ncbi:porin [Psychroflexus planctonicus]|uniref:Porin n=1 Tax=Psychroflexus planctonicus TaxID=1526575 RepID=A0ABQ1SG97_9FLAO|nr:porin [Psychroflexus planctonicus]GGE32793.1 porin [Psychroflexus planctonicus]
MKFCLAPVLFILSFLSVYAQNDTDNNIDKDTVYLEDGVKASKPLVKWNDLINIRGYAQVRYNRIGETNTDLRCQQCDRSWGGDGGFFFRRIRIVFFGNIHERVYFYIQPDFASSPGGDRQQFSQIRDAYFDVALDSKKTFRFRFGQTKIPFGFENLQSSQNRIPLDRHDGLNSAVANERDIGVFFYWAPKKIRDRMRKIAQMNLKHSGDYGVFGFGAFNGQTANQPDRNRNAHWVARLSYPFELRNGQFFEPGIQAYSGKFVLPNVTEGVITNNDMEYIDQRVALSAVWYPQPFGIQAEYNIGRGPEFNPETNTIETQSLNGGYATLSYYIDSPTLGLVIPFTRYHNYAGGKKHELDARKHRVSELEVGIEWQPIRNLEFVMMYTFSDRTFEDALNPMNRQTGRLLRLQAQVNF